jgi:hypothetical protein
MPNGERGGSSEQHAKAGEQSHKNSSGSGSKEPGSEGSTRGFVRPLSCLEATCGATGRNA